MLMKYVCLVYLEEEKLRAVPDRECAAAGDGFKKRGDSSAGSAAADARRRKRCVSGRDR